MNIFKNKWMGLAYVSPYIIGFLIFGLYPLLASLYLSFNDYNSLFRSPKWTWFNNYIELFAKDPSFMKTLGVTILYVFMTVPLKLIFALFIAFILNFKLKGISFFRAAYYIPSLLGGSVAVAILWRSIFSGSGLINSFFKMLGFSEINFFGKPTLALFMISLLAIWQFGSSMVIFLAGLQTIPKDYYEAAEIDGAPKWYVFFKITIPLISPIIFFNLVMQTSGAFQEFNAPFLITAGRPNGFTQLYSMLIYNTVFTSTRYGYGSSMAWVMFWLVASVAFVYYIFSKKLVFYQDEK